jgi:hypothetical protein
MNQPQMRPIEYAVGELDSDSVARNATPPRATMSVPNRSNRRVVHANSPTAIGAPTMTPRATASSAAYSDGRRDAVIATESPHRTAPATATSITRAAGGRVVPAARPLSAAW